MPFYVGSGIVEGWFGFIVALSLPKLQSFALSVDQRVLGQAFVLPGLLSERKKSSFGPCRFLLLCQSVCLPVSYCHRNRFSIRLCICLSLLSSLSSPCIFHPLLLPPLSPCAHLITAASVQHICLVSDVKLRTRKIALCHVTAASFTLPSPK